MLVTTLSRIKPVKAIEGPCSWSCPWTKKSPAWSKELASEGRCKTVKAHTEFLENFEAFLISEFAIQFQSPLILT